MHSVWKKCLYSFPFLVAAAMMAPGSEAALTRNPTGVNVSASSPTTLLIRFADDAGATFTSTEAVFCSIDPNAGTGGIGALSCPAGGGQLLGRLPRTLDRGSTTTGRTSITDIMTIPISVVRRAVVRAKRGEFSDFFYVRRFDPTAGGAPVYVAVTCRLTGGTARTPLSLNRVELYGVEPNNNRVRLLRVDGDNIKTGVIKADIRYTGTGLLEGWWEVATPTDQVIAEVDRFTAGSISEDQRTVQRRFRRVKRFRVQVPLSGRLTLKGPRYSELPHQTPGFYQVILRIEASKGQASRSNLANTGGSQTLFSGGVAGFPLQALRYRVGDLEAAQSAALNPRLTVDDPGGGKVRQVAMVWDVLQNGAVAVMVEVFDPESQEKHQLAAPMSKGLVILPRRWTEGRDVDSLRYMVTVLGRDQKPVGERITVSRVK